jgi:hypothetical protein
MQIRLARGPAGGEKGEKCVCVCVCVCVGVGVEWGGSKGSAFKELRWTSGSFSDIEDKARETSER